MNRGWAVLFFSYEIQIAQGWIHRQVIRKAVRG